MIDQPQSTPARKPEQQQQYISQNPSPQQIYPDIGVSKDWGMAIGLCVLMGVQLWQLIKSQVTSDSDLQKELIKSLLEERKLLIQAVLDRKT